MEQIRKKYALLKRSRLPHRTKLVFGLSTETRDPTGPGLGEKTMASPPTAGGGSFLPKRPPPPPVPTPRSVSRGSAPGGGQRIKERGKVAC